MIIEVTMENNFIFNQEELYLEVFENSRDVIFITDVELRLIKFNPEFENILKFDNRFLNVRILNYLIPINYKKLVIDYHNNVLKLDEFKKSEEILELYLLDLFGKEIPFEIKILKFKENNSDFLLFLCRDVSFYLEAQNVNNKLIEDLRMNNLYIEQNSSELVRLNQIIIESEKQLLELNASKDRFFSIISHDLKNPFQALIGYSEILTKHTHTFSIEEISEMSGNLNLLTKNVYKLLENLLEWSRLQRGVMPFIPEEFDLYELIQSNISIASMMAIPKEITLESNLESSLNIVADINMINTIIRNLVSNSIKFSNIGGNVKINYESDQNNHIIKIIDNGVGMSEQTKNKLFRIDEKITSVGTNNEIGTGLGLILCKELVNSNKGDIWVESEIGVGSTFCFNIPKNLEELIS